MPISLISFNHNNVGCCGFSFCLGRKTAWNSQGTSLWSIASRKTAANTSWSSMRPRRKTAATTRSKPTAASPWLNSWCRVSVSHACAELHYEPLLSLMNTPSAHSHALPIVVWPCHSWHAVYLWDTVSLAIARIILPRLPRRRESTCQLKLEDVDHISPEGHRSA